MKTIVYNKLVRDKIPEIIKSSGKNPVTELMDETAYKKALDQKLLEETKEYLESGSEEELADIAEVFYSILAARGISINEIEQLRAEKAAERGGFEQRIFLKEVHVED